MLTSDQLTIYFTSYRPEPARFPADATKRDIWTATRDSKDEPFGTPTKIGAPISLDGVGDYSPVILTDGETLYFQSFRESGHPGDTYPWVSHWDATAESWSEPELFIGPFNTLDVGLDVDVSSIDFSSDSRVMYFQTRRNGTYDIYQTRREDVNDPFGVAEPLVGINTADDGELNPRVSADGLTLVFSHLPNDTFAPPWGRIWIATRSDVSEPFSDPMDINDFGLGSNINRGGNAVEWAPFLSSDWPADGSKLYYSYAPNSPNWTTYEATWSLPCDLDRTGNCDVGDLDSLYALGDLQRGVPVVDGENERYDLNGDVVIDTGDLDAWLSEAATANRLASPYSQGDANLDGRVDAADLNAIALNWQITDASSWAQGDFDANRIVDSNDLNSLALNWQASGGDPPPAAVPEPAGSVMMLLSMLLLTRRRH